MYNVIKAAYNNPMFCIKTEHRLYEYFSSSTGMKQGCILSPILSNIFQNDLHDIFQNNCDPVSINQSIFCHWIHTLLILCHGLMT